MVWSEFKNAHCFIKYDMTVLISYLCEHWSIFLQYYHIQSSEICVCLYDIDLQHKTKFIVFDQVLLAK